MNYLVNIVAFKTGWIASILGAANETPLLGPAVVLVAILMHLRLANDTSGELKLIVLTGAIGAAWETAMIAKGWLAYPNGMVVAGIAPYWIIGMWMLFATTLNVLFRRLQSRLLLASVIGAVFGPVAYFAGAKTGAVVIDDIDTAMIVVAGTWALLFPALLLLARSLNGGSIDRGVVQIGDSRRFRNHV